MRDGAPGKRLEEKEQRGVRAARGRDTPLTPGRPTHPTPGATPTPGRGRGAPRTGWGSSRGRVLSSHSSTLSPPPPRGRAPDARRTSPADFDTPRVPDPTATDPHPYVSASPLSGSQSTGVYAGPSGRGEVTKRDVRSEGGRSKEGKGREREEGWYGGRDTESHRGVGKCKPPR